MTQKGYFITFEGIDGCGKSTQLENVYEMLTEQGYDCVRTREPGALELGTALREIVLHYKGTISNNCEMFLFLADRAQHVDTFITPMLSSGKVVLCDRHTDSTLAYQGYGREGDVEKLTFLNKLATSGITPDLTIVFDVSIETGAMRAGKDTDRLESAGREFFERVRQGYIELAEKYPERIKIVNGENSKEKVYNDVKSLIMDLMR